MKSDINSRNFMQLYDLHIHTFLSDCASKTDAEPTEYIKAAEQNGLDAIGFSDHAWDIKVPGASPWYQKQPFERLAALKELLRDFEYGNIKILFGAESEFKDGILAVGEEAAERLDYIIVPHSHTHMRGFILPEGWETPEKHAQYLIKSFYELVTHQRNDLFFGVAHPMFPVGTGREDAERIYEYISDADLNECLYAAKENHIFLELNTSSIFSIGEADLKNSFYARFFHNAKAAGNDFFMGSDKHSVVRYGEFDRFMKISEYMRELGLEQEDFSKAYNCIMELN